MSKELSEKWEAIGRDILAVARNELYVNMRFLDLALSAFTYHLDTSVKLAGTDGWHIFFEPFELSDIFRKDRQKISRVYLHMVFHCMFRHLTRMGDRQKELWDLSCDIAMESIIDGLGKRSIRRAVDPVRTEVYALLREELKVITAEGVYAVLEDRKLNQAQLEKIQEAFYVDDHKYWPDPKDDEKNPQNAVMRQQLDEKWQDIADRTETEMETFGKEQADDSGDLMEQVKVSNKRRQDYRSFLRKFAVLKEEMQVDTDSFDYGFYSYGLRLYGNMPLIEPQEFKEVQKIQDFVIAIDTSMSTKGELVKNFLSETYGILMETESFFKKINIHIIQCDEKIQEDVKITSREELDEYMEHLDLKGGGGTDFRPVFAYVGELLEKGTFDRLKGLLYFTDGYGIFPTKRPPYDTAFLFMEEDFSDREVPPWAIRLVLDRTDLEPEEKKVHTDIKFV